MGLFGFGSSSQIGVSIGTSSIKIAEIQKKGKGYNLLHFGVAQVSDEAISNREVVNHMAVVDALKGLVEELKLKGKTVITSLSGASVIVKKILLDQTPDKELEDTLLWEAEQYIPFDINDVAYDYQVVTKNGPEGKMEIVLAACKRNIIESYQAVVRDAGLKPGIVDLDLFALQNAFETNYPPEGTTALVDIGASSMKFSICAEGQPILTRDSAVGGRNLTAEIQRQLNVSYQEAEILKIDGNTQGQMPQEVADLMHLMCENFATEIKRSIDFYIASNAGSPVTSILLAGGSAKLPNLTRMVEEKLGIPSALLDPFHSIQYDSKIFSSDYVDAVSSMAAIPIGLALRGFEK